MSENEMGYRGSKSVYLKDTVKEQRVDGSCIIKSKLMLLRCTLMGGESRYPVKIPSNQIKNIKYYSSNSYSAPTKGRLPYTFCNNSSCNCALVLSCIQTPNS